LTSGLSNGSEFKTNNKHTVTVVTDSEVKMNERSKGPFDCCCKFLLVSVD